MQLQDELQVLLRVTARGILERQRAILASGQLSPEPGRDEEGNQVRASVNRLQERVLDSQLRAVVAEFLDFCARLAAGIDLASEYPYGQVIDDASRDEAVARLQRQAVEVADAYAGLTKLLGAGLRREMDRKYLAAEAAEGAAPGGSKVKVL